MKNENAGTRAQKLRGGRAGLLRRYMTTVAAVALAASAQPGFAASNIDSGSSYLASNIGGSVNPDFRGGTLTLDTNTTLSQNFALGLYSTNTIDATGHSVVFSGIFSGVDGPINFTDSVGGGKVTLTGANSYTGATTIGTGATLALAGSGTIAASSSLTNNGVFDISGTTGTVITTLSGSGTVNLGAQSLAISSASTSFDGVITGTGGLLITGGTQSLGGANSYTGGTVISGGTLVIGTGTNSGSILGNVATSGTLAFNRSDALTFTGIISGSGGISQQGGGVTTLTQVETYTGTTGISAGTLALAAGASIASSSGVTANGTFDISATSATSIKSLSGSGTVELGGAALTFTNASGAFSGVIQGSGGITLVSGTQTLSGTNSYSGATTVLGGTLRLGGATIANNITNSGTVSFYSSAPITMTGVITGAGAVSQTGSGTTTITAAQAYTGATTITFGTLALSGAGSIASSSGLASEGGKFDISAAAAGASIATLSGSGTVVLGSQTLTLTNAAGTYSGAIQGAGDLVIQSGRETLSGTNTFTGTTTIGAATLYLTAGNALSTSSKVINNGTLDISQATSSFYASASLTSLAGTGSVVLGSATLVLTNAADTFSGSLSGAGGLTISGGTATLTGTNTYTGVTTISSGALVIAGGGSLAPTSSVVANGLLDISGAAGAVVKFGSLSGSGTASLGAKSIELASGSGIFSGTITGSGGLVLSGGTQTLSGSNNYTGGTVINAGTLQIGNGGSSGSILGDVVNNGTLAFNRTDSFTFDGAISGTGGVSQNGAGTAILTAASTYTGGTAITAGTLQIGNGGTSGSITGNVTNNGTLAFNRSDASVFAGVVSGTGGLSQIGSGTLTLTTANTYTGSTKIQSGSQLVLTGSGSIAQSQSVIVDGSLNLSAATAPQIMSLAGGGTVALGARTLTITTGADSFTGAISGTGGLTVQGGKQTLAGNNTYTGATTVNGGTLSVTGSLTSSSGITVNSGGTLSGSGQLPAVVVNSGGKYAPSAGATVNGNLSLLAGSSYVVAVDADSAASSSVTGSASLAGSLAVTSANGDFFLGRKVAVLTANGGISGTFTASPIQSTGAQFRSTVTQDANNVYLQINLDKLSPLLADDATVNQASVVEAIDNSIAAGNQMPLAFENLGNNSSTELGAHATQLSGELGANLVEAGNALQRPFWNAIFQHMHDGRPAGKQPAAASRGGGWFSAFLGSGLVAGDSATVGSAKLKSQVSGFSAGADWPVSSRVSLGGAVSVGNNKFHLGDGLGSGTNTSVQAAAYGFVQASKLVYGAFAASLSFNDFSTDRTLSVSGTDRLVGSPKSYAIGGRYETGLNLKSFAPYMAVENTLVSISSYKETASSGLDQFALNYAARTQNLASLELGARQSVEVRVGSSWNLKLSDRLALSHAFSESSTARARFEALPDSSFVVQGAKTGRDALLLSLGAKLTSDAGFGLNLQLDSAVSSRSQSYVGVAGASYRW